MFFVLMIISSIASMADTLIGSIQSIPQSKLIIAIQIIATRFDAVFMNFQ